MLGGLILVPIIGSIVIWAAGFRNPQHGWVLGCSTLILTGVMVILQLPGAITNTSQTFQVGGIPATYGVELVADSVSFVFIGISLLIILGAMVHTRTIGPRTTPVISAILLLTGGTIGITLAGDLFTLYVFIELLAIATYALIATAESRWATYAAFKYLLIGTLGASLYLLGTAMAFIATGALNMRFVAQEFSILGYTDPLVIGSFIFILVGLAIKIALFPVHTWLADAHAAAPDAISAIISGLLPAIAVYALLRILFTVYTLEFIQRHGWVIDLLLLGGVASLILGSFYAVLQRRLKLLLAYSTIANMGLAIIGITIANETALYGSLLHLIGHGVIKAALFILVGLFAIACGAKTLSDYAGLATDAPYLSAGFVLLGVALIGIPPTVGFMGKYYIALGAIQSGSWAIMALVIASTILTVAYIVPVIDRLYFYERDGATARRSLPVGSQFSVGIAIVLTILLGFGAIGLEGVFEETITELINSD